LFYTYFFYFFLLSGLVERVHTRTWFTAFICIRTAGIISVIVSSTHTISVL